MHESPRGAQEQYEEVGSRLAESGSFNSLSDWPAEGILFHAAGPTDDGWRVVDVWESEKAFGKFGEKIVPILQEVGFPGEPRFSRSITS